MRTKQVILLYVHTYIQWYRRHVITTMQFLLCTHSYNIDSESDDEPPPELKEAIAKAKASAKASTRPPIPTTTVSKRPFHRFSQLPPGTYLIFLIVHLKNKCILLNFIIWLIDWLIAIKHIKCSNHSHMVDHFRWWVIHFFISQHFLHLLINKLYQFSCKWYMWNAIWLTFAYSLLFWFTGLLSSLNGVVISFFLFIIFDFFVKILISSYWKPNCV